MNDTPDAHTPTTDETFRAMVRTQMLDGAPTTLIITRQGRGGAGHVWLTDNGRTQTTVVLTRHEAEQLAGMLGDASSAWAPH